MTRLAVALFALALFSPLAADAQAAGRVYKVAIIFTASPIAEMTEETHSGLRALFGELRRLGYVEGLNLVVERHSALGHPERFPAIAAEVVRLNPDVIVVPSTRLALAVRAATTTIPIVGEVFAPVERGLATSLARPGGNVTGITGGPGPQILGKWLSLLQEAVPHASRVAFLGLSSSWNAQMGRRLREAAQQLGITLVHVPMDGPFGEAQLLNAFRSMERDRAQALLLENLPEYWVKRHIIADLAIRHRVPAIHQSLDFVQDGLLMSYGTGPTWGRLAGYVDRILKGARRADLPIEQPTEYKLAVNLKTAKTLGLTIPPSVLARADEVLGETHTITLGMRRTPHDDHRNA